MTDRAIHPNTKAILKAWRRLSSSSTGAFGDPKVSDFPNLLSSLFVLKQVDTNIWPFTNAGNELSRKLGRDLIEQDFLSLWRGRDMALVAAQLDAVRFSGTPGLIRSKGETISGECIDIEITLAPLRTAGVQGERLLGLYQVLSDESILRGRPVWRHSVEALFAPQQYQAETPLRLVASNE